MRFDTLRVRVALILVALLGLAALPATAAPVFGPQVFTKVNPSGTPDVYTETFTAPKAGAFAMWVQNGDDGGSRISSGSIVIGTTTVAGDADFQKPREFFRKPVSLAAGSNQIQVTLNAPDPGTYITVLILPLGEQPDVIVGRVLLPYGSTSSNLVLDLKNGAHYYNRSVRIHYYDPSGALVAASDRIVLQPRASLSQTATSLIATGNWTEGSIEVFYAGRGSARVFGMAATTDPTSAISSIVNLQHAGSRRRSILEKLNE
jgi:hypothetical protein